MATKEQKDAATKVLQSAGIVDEQIIKIASYHNEPVNMANAIVMLNKLKLSNDLFEFHVHHCLLFEDPSDEAKKISENPDAAEKAAEQTIVISIFKKAGMLDIENVMLKRALDHENPVEMANAMVTLNQLKLHSYELQQYFNDLDKSKHPNAEVMQIIDDRKTKTIQEVLDHVSKSKLVVHNQLPEIFSDAHRENNNKTISAVESLCAAEKKLGRDIITWGEIRSSEDVKSGNILNSLATFFDVSLKAKADNAGEPKQEPPKPHGP